MTIREKLQAAVLATAKADAIAAMKAFDALIENNVYASLQEAAEDLKHKLLVMASDDCEGTRNCGQDRYTREFLVAGVKYVGTLSVEYGRFDKTYYYIDSASFSYETKPKSSEPC